MQHFMDSHSTVIYFQKVSYLQWQIRQRVTTDSVEKVGACDWCLHITNLLVRRGASNTFPWG